MRHQSRCKEANKESCVKIIHVVGARPNFMKIAIERYNEQKVKPKFASLLVHTGQHYDQAMSQSFFEDLGLPRPDLKLKIGEPRRANRQDYDSF